MVYLACGKACIVSCYTEYETTSGFSVAISTHCLPPCVVKLSVLQTHNILSFHLINYLDMYMTTALHSYELMQLCGVSATLSL